MRSNVNWWGAASALMEVRQEEAPQLNSQQELHSALQIAERPRQWVWRRGHWSRSACLMRAMTYEAKLRRLGESCKGSLEPLVELVKKPRGARPARL